MKKILLISPLSEQYSGIQNYGVPSIGVHRIAAFLISHGQDVTIYDCNIHGEIDPYLEKKYDIIGISILNDTLPLSLKMFIRLSKQFPDALLVAGGAESIVNYEAVFDNSPCNIIVLGEGELPMLDLCNDKPLGEIKGLIVRNIGIEINDNLLWDYYKDIDFLKMGWREYWEKNRITGDPKNKDNIVRLVTSSHCNRGCIDEKEIVNGKKIIDINIGDEINAFDELNNTPAKTKVIDKQILKRNDIYEIETKIGKKITITSEHPIFTKRGWIEAKDLTLNDEILYEDSFS